MKYLDAKFSVGGASDAYRDNYDRIFGEKKPTEPCDRCGTATSIAREDGKPLHCDDCRAGR